MRYEGRAESGEYLDLRSFRGFARFRVSGFQGFRVSGFQGFRVSVSMAVSEFNMLKI